MDNVSTFQIGMLVGAVGFAFCGYAMGDKRGHPGLGMVLGFLFGLFGLLVLLFFPKRSRRVYRPVGRPGALAMASGRVACPTCRSPLKPTDTVCRRCGARLQVGHRPVAPPVADSIIKPEAWWYQEEGQQAPSPAPRPGPAGAPPPPPPPPR